ncbi:hypothetical protein AAHA92_21213 [Salvia divinorum]|uniref:Uncharacterized protein n=1 Tax=Salvia divinorum TaxID=28513 RepID=A0ABD1GN58_SALDI
MRTAKHISCAANASLLQLKPVARVNFMILEVSNVQSSKFLSQKLPATATLETRAAMFIKAIRQVITLRKAFVKNIGQVKCWRFPRLV